MVLKCDPCREKNRPPISRAICISPHGSRPAALFSPPSHARGFPVLFCSAGCISLLLVCVPVSLRPAPLVFPFKNYIRKKRC